MHTQQWKFVADRTHSRWLVAVCWYAVLLAVVQLQVIPGWVSAKQIEFRQPQLPAGTTLSGQIIDNGQLGVIEVQKPASSFLPAPAPGSKGSAANMASEQSLGSDADIPDAVPSFESFDDREEAVRQELERARRSVADQMLESLPQKDGVETIRQRYPDGKVRVIRQVAQDAAGNYYNHGAWKVFSKSGAVVAEGQFERGKMEGQWRRYHTSSSGGLFSTPPFDKYRGQFLSVASFSDGKLDGPWTIYDQDQQKIFEIPYSNGKRDGTATWWYPSSNKMREATFRDGVMDGEVLEWDEQGKLTRREQFVSGQRVIRNTSYYRGQRKSEEQFFLDAKFELDGEDQWWDAKPAPFLPSGQRVQHGPIMRWYENGQPRMQGQYKSDQRVGQFTWWHENGGRHLVAFYREGKKEGLWTWWHPNGMKSIQGEYKDDEAVGPWTWWEENGRVHRQEDFDKPVESRGELTEPADSEVSTEGSFSIRVDNDRDSTTSPAASSEDDATTSERSPDRESPADQEDDTAMPLLLDGIDQLEEISPLENGLNDAG